LPRPNTPAYSILASPDPITAAERSSVAAKLAAILEMRPDDVLQQITSTKKFVYLKRRVAADVAAQLDGLQLPGVGKIEETKRTYVDGGVPGTRLAANLLGFANNDGQGNYVIDGYNDRVLAGQAR